MEKVASLNTSGNRGDDLNVEPTHKHVRTPTPTYARRHTCTPTTRGISDQSGGLTPRACNKAQIRAIGRSKCALHAYAKTAAAVVIVAVIVVVIVDVVGGLHHPTSLLPTSASHRSPA
ncbi:hypothetical protein EGR_04268 [Echinococcus granulosus]|uniref:Uncharacterized protein n=1 Tax=Echinococcus granulosus TaxID=6210 RepID=W6V422_ECHGR|nr:hypothetical protein EGR_04268 [Echinococcus granulosus]EUB60829.1 hypothetical protein EGR_04268 [Echinococcus granulosus]